MVDKRWHYKARIGKVLTESLRRETDLIQAVAILLNEWDSEGATAIVLPATTIDKYVQSVKNLTLRGPRIDWKTVGVPRYIFASVPVHTHTWQILDMLGVFIGRTNQTVHT